MFWFLLVLKVGIAIPFAYYSVLDWTGKATYKQKSAIPVLGTSYFLSCIALAVYLLAKIIG